MPFSGLMQLHLDRADETVTASCPEELVFPLLASSPVQGNRSKATPPRLGYEENCISAKEPDRFCIKIFNKKHVEDCREQEKSSKFSRSNSLLSLQRTPANADTKREMWSSHTTTYKVFVFQS